MSQLTVKALLAAFLILPVAGVGHSAPPGTMNELVDIPTADILDYGSFESNFRFFTGGGLLTKLNFGVFRRLNIGFSFTLDRFIGADKIDAQEPEIQIKFRLFDGSPILPALSLGFDGQGYRHNREISRYYDEERGLYLSLSHEILFPGFFIHGGMAISDFDNDKLMGFVGLHCDVSERFAMFVEYDNIHNVDVSRLNSGFRVFVTPSFNVEFAVRDIGAGEDVEGFKRDHERIIRLEYVGAF